MSVHELKIEDDCECDAGFDVRNYVAIAFCVVWLIVDSILMLGVYRVRQHFAHCSERYIDYIQLVKRIP